MFLMMKAVMSVHEKSLQVVISDPQEIGYNPVMDILQLSEVLDGLLDIHHIKDYPKALNGLQVQNEGEIKKVGLAVDVCQATIEMAIEAECNMLFVHHGLFWGGLQPVRGPQYDKLSALIKNNIGLYSAHLPLDVHPLLGNNRALANVIGLEKAEGFGDHEGQLIGLRVECKDNPPRGFPKHWNADWGQTSKSSGRERSRPWV